jgi:hypothetical protein
MLVQIAPTPDASSVASVGEQSNYSVQMPAEQSEQPKTNKNDGWVEVSTDENEGEIVARRKRATLIRWRKLCWRQGNIITLYGLNR